jgi:hypothetical protein
MNGVECVTNCPVVRGAECSEVPPGSPVAPHNATNDFVFRRLTVSGGLDQQRPKDRQSGADCHTGFENELQKHS